MVKEFSSSREVSREEVSDPEQDANGVAFLLASAAFLALAEVHMRRDGAAGLAVMDEIEGQIDEALTSFADENTYEVARPDILLHAARKVRALLDVGRLMVPETRPLQ